MSLDADLDGPTPGTDTTAPAGDTRQFSESETPLGTGQVIFWGGARLHNGTFFAEGDKAYFIPDNPDFEPSYNLALLENFVPLKSVLRATPPRRKILADADIFQFGADTFVLKDPEPASTMQAAESEYVAQDTGHYAPMR